MAISQILSASLASGVPASSNMPTGSVLQVVYQTYNTSTSTTSNAAWVDTGLTATITPKSSTSKIAIFVTQSWYLNASSAQNNVGASIKILRNGATDVFKTEADWAASYEYASTWSASGARERAGLLPICVVDSPATTSATSYKTQMMKGNSGTMTWQVSSEYSTIILMEIAA